MPVCCIVPCPAEETGFYSSPFVHDKKILYPTSSLTASKSITSPPNISNSLISLDNTETSRSNPARNKLCTGLPCFFTLIGRRLSSAPPTRQDSTKPTASIDINLFIFAGAVICVSSRLNPWLFRLPNSVLSANAYRMLLSLALFITANHQQAVARQSDGVPQDSVIAHTASPAPIFYPHLFSAPVSGHPTPVLCHLFPLSARFPCSGCSKKSRLDADTPAIHCQ